MISKKKLAAGEGGQLTRFYLTGVLADPAANAMMVMVMANAVPVMREGVGGAGGGQQGQDSGGGYDCLHVSLSY